MLTKYVNKKIDLSRFIELNRFVDVYRTKSRCQCTDKANIRQTLLVVDKDIIVTKVIRCKACVTRKEATNGNV